MAQRSRNAVASKRVYDGSIESRVGEDVLHRLGGRIRFESTVEQRAVILLGASKQVVGIERAEAVEVHLPDGVRFTYTPDYTVTLTDGRVITLECKPHQFLPAILRSEPERWQARAARLKGLERPLHIVTERDMPEARLQNVRLFRGFYNVEYDRAIRLRCVSALQERGRLPLPELRAYLQGVLAVPLTDIDPTLYFMLARHELVADASRLMPESSVDLAAASIELPPPPLGMPLVHLLSRLESEDEADPGEDGNAPSPPISSPEELRFLKTKMGERYLLLFSRYSDPGVPITSELASRLCEIGTCSASTVYRFRRHLAEAGGPGITFPDLARHVAGGRPVNPRNRVSLEVQAIIENTATQYYFQPVGTTNRASTVANLHELIRKVCLASGQRPPVHTTVAQHLDRLERQYPDSLGVARLDKEAARALEARLSSLSVTWYGELLGIDVTPCDVFSKPVRIETCDTRQKKRGKRQRPQGARRGNIVYVVDIATGQILRSEIFLGGIGAAQVLEVLRSVFLGDTRSLTEAGVTVVPQGQGLPLEVRIDSGSEFRNKQVGRVIAKLGLGEIDRDAWSVHRGGKEERSLGTVTKQHHILPGTSMGSISARGSYDAQGNAELILSELNRIHQQNVERYNSLCAPHQKLTRQEHAQHLLDAGRSVWRPLNQSQVTYVRERMHPQEIRECTRVGINLHGLTYVSPQLGPLVLRKAEVEVYYRPDDISTAQALDPVSGAFIELHAKLPDGIKAPLSLKEWREVKRIYAAAKQSALDRVRTPQQIVAEVLALRQKDAAAVQQSKHVRRVNPVADSTIEDGLSTIKAAKLTFEDNEPEG